MNVELNVVVLLREKWERATLRVLVGSRKDADLSQTELAERLEWTRNVIANLESGRHVLKLVDFLLIAWALKVSPTTLLERIIRW